MLRWALIFLVVALVAAAMGFGSIAGTASGIAVTLFWIFIVMCVVLFLAGTLSGGSRRPLP